MSLMTQKVANKAEDLKEDLFSSEVDAELSSNQVPLTGCGGGGHI